MRRAHKTLKIKYGATFEEVKQAYKKQALEWHPDRFPADDEELQKKATHNFHRVTEAYKRLETWHTNKEAGKYDDHQPDYATPDSDRGTSDENWVDDVTRDLPQFITRTWKNGDKYEGMAISERMHGQGIFTYANGSVYTGQFKYGTMDGLGKFVFSNGDVYSGGFRENQFHGQGKMDFASGDRYTGNFAKDQYHGEGVFVSTRGTVHAGIWDYGSLLSEPEPPFNRY
jgi:hypothetical protein